MTAALLVSVCLIAQSGIDVFVLDHTDYVLRFVVCVFVRKPIWIIWLVGIYM